MILTQRRGLCRVAGCRVRGRRRLTELIIVLPCVNQTRIELRSTVRCTRIVSADGFHQRRNLHEVGPRSSYDYRFDDVHGAIECALLPRELSVPRDRRCPAGLSEACCPATPPYDVGEVRYGSAPLQRF